MSFPADPFLSAIESRVSCYGLRKESPILNTRLEGIIRSIIQHAPSAFNVQSTRAVILLEDDHEALWDVADSCLKEGVSEGAYAYLSRGIVGFKRAYGTVLFFEDEAALEALGSKNASVSHMVAEWSHHSNGMHQVLVWTALQLEGLGCNLQHYNFVPSFGDEVRQRWKIPDTWSLQAQLVFGAPEAGLVRKRERTYLPIEGRLVVFGA
ncbi:Nitroreductase-like protein [Aspergillus pseudoustus]|uniref:Nitroreductase-like protein n=1 Tax=Aspergillus pseudoustus TaxID=1810923 RepID=A0ABR4INI6_9EURO